MKFEAIPAKELNRWIRDDRAVIIDLRSREAYRKRHIRGAVNLPYEQFEEEFPRFNGREIILYCERGSVSLAMARELAGKQYPVKTVVGGIRAYRGPYLAGIDVGKQD